MATCSKSKLGQNNNNVRSISLPCRSHPTTAEIEEELSNLLNSWQSSSTPPNAKAIKNGLWGLEALYKTMDHLLNLQITQKALSDHHQCRRRRQAAPVDDLLDTFIGLLDICGTAKEFMSQLKQQGRDIHYSLRRSRTTTAATTTTAAKGADLKNMAATVAKYTCLRGKTNKEAKKLISELKKMKNNQISCDFEQDQVVHVHVCSIIRQVVTVSICVLDSLASFLSAPVSKLLLPKSKWFVVVSKLLRKRGDAAVACENQLQNVNELQSLDVALDDCLSKKTDSIPIQVLVEAQIRLQSLEVTIEAIEDGLDCLFRALIRTRATLLNIASSSSTSI